MQYYPDGLPYDECYRADEQPYKYRELIGIYRDPHGFDSYDNGRRHYSPLPCIGSPLFDPLAEYFYHESPYAHCGNDPVNYIDPSGMIKLNHNDDDSDENIENEERRLLRSYFRKRTSGSSCHGKNTSIQWTIFWIIFILINGMLSLAIRRNFRLSISPNDGSNHTSYIACISFNISASFTRRYFSASI